MTKKTVFITGISGFIGFHLASQLMQRGYKVAGCDNFIPYYEISLKEARAKQLHRQGIPIHRLDLCEEKKLTELLGTLQPDLIVHLAAQAGVRYCLSNPMSYLDNNLKATFHVLESSRILGSIPLILASSSSVYGNTTPSPFKESAAAGEPESIYGATKRSTELLAHSYAKCWNIPITALRFFTVYGPWGRPDMAYYKFSRMILNEEPIPLYGDGLLQRDFTYIDDTIDGIIRTIERQPKKFSIFNLGKGHPETTLQLIEALETALGKKAILSKTEGPKGDVEKTIADTSLARECLGFEAKTPLIEGIQLFTNWFQSYEKIAGNTTRCHIP